MSYDQAIDNKVVYFREEEDYLDCRLQYLKYCKDAVMPEVTFIQYIQNGMYPTRITVENIVSVNDHWIPTESSFTVGSNSFNIFSNNTVYDTTGQYNADDYASLYIGEPVVLDHALTPTEINEAFGASAQAVMSDGGLLPIEDKEELADPIEHRWEILDLRGDDDEHD